MEERPRGGYSVEEQYAKRKQRARESWAWHMLFALVPFCVFIWGPRWLAIPAWVGFAAGLVWGAYRQIRIDRCPACEASRWIWRFGFLYAYARPSRSSHCRSCGTRLLIE